jgi:hypothetical protein
MARGRKPLGDRAMTDAERQRRRREKLKTSDQDNARRLRRSLLKTFWRWSEGNPPEGVSMQIVLDALDDFATLLTVLSTADRNPKKAIALLERYNNCEPLTDASSIEDLLGGADALKRAAEKLRDV